jgi:hypothetical protein
VHATRAELSSAHDAFARVIRELGPPDSTGFWPEGAVDRFVKDNGPLLTQLGQTESLLKNEIEAAFKEIDQSWIATLVVGGTERNERFGQDKRNVALRVAKGLEKRGVTGNLGWSRADAGEGVDDPWMIKAGLEYSALLIQGSTKGNDVTLSASAAYEFYQDVPDAAHDRIAKLNMKMEYPLGDAIKIPISVTWASHADLLSDEDEVRGHVGFTVDLSGLKKAQ